MHRGPEELVIELGIDHALEWDPQDGEVTWADGTRTRALIDPGGTTRPGELHAGQLARLVLRLDAAPPAAAPVRLVLVGPGGLLIVDVEAA